MIHHAYFGGTMTVYEAMTLACPAHLRCFTPESKFHTCDSRGYRGTVVKTTPGSHMKSLRVKTKTPSQTKSSFKLFRKPSIFGLCQKPLRSTKICCRFCPIEPTSANDSLMLFLVEPSIPKGLRRKIRCADLFPFGR